MATGMWMSALLGSSLICVILSLSLMNGARDRVEKGHTQSNLSPGSANANLATANMILYGVFVLCMCYALYEQWSCKEDTVGPAQPVSA